MRELSFISILPTHKKRLSLLDKAALFASFCSPLSGIPQVIEVIKGNTAGVSLLSWFAFIVFTLIFLVYGLVHNVKPMIIANLLWLLVEISIIAGIIVNR